MSINAQSLIDPGAPSLLDASNQLGKFKYLVEAIFMAASDLGDMKKTNAIQNVAEVIHREIDDLDELLDAIRERSKS